MACTCSLRGATGLTVTVGRGEVCATACVPADITASTARRSRRLVIRGGVIAPWVIVFMIGAPLLDLLVEVEFGADLQAQIVTRDAVVIGALSPKDLRAEHHALGGVPEQVDRGVLPLVKSVGSLKVGIVHLVEAVADRGGELL